MKKYMLLSMMLVTGIMTSQEVQPKLEAFGPLVKATYYYDSGQIQQTGFFKDGKPDGQWVSYDSNGNKNAVGEYTQGNKTGKWLFWSNEQLSEVNYSQSRIANVKRWKHEIVIDRL